MKRTRHETGSNSPDVRELCYGGFQQCLECYAINQTEDAEGLGCKRCSKCGSHRIKIHLPCLKRPTS